MALCASKNTLYLHTANTVKKKKIPRMYNHATRLISFIIFKFQYQMFLRVLHRNYLIIHLYCFIFHNWCHADRKATLMLNLLRLQSTLERWTRVCSTSSEMEAFYSPGKWVCGEFLTHATYFTTSFFPLRVIKDAECVAAFVLLWHFLWRRVWGCYSLAHMWPLVSNSALIFDQLFWKCLRPPWNSK